MIAYEAKLNQDLRWALQEGGMHFEEASAVHHTLRRITKRLEELGVPYAVAGGMALFVHGYRRFTENVDILVTRDGLRLVRECPERLALVPSFSGSKNLRDSASGVRVEFLVAGEYPGDGKPKPVAFPDPAAAGVERDGVRYLSLPKLIELKLASGLTNPLRLKDIADVQELIRLLKLPAEFAGQLDPYVRGKFVELWTLIQEN